MNVVKFVLVSIFLAVLFGCGINNSITTSPEEKFVQMEEPKDGPAPPTSDECPQGYKLRLEKLIGFSRVSCMQRDGDKWVGLSHGPFRRYWANTEETVLMERGSMDHGRPIGLWEQWDFSGTQIKEPQCRVEKDDVLLSPEGRSQQDVVLTYLHCSCFDEDLLPPSFEEWLFLSESRYARDTFYRFPDIPDREYCPMVGDHEVCGSGYDCPLEKPECREKSRHHFKRVASKEVERKWKDRCLSYERTVGVTFVIKPGYGPVHPLKSRGWYTVRALGDTGLSTYWKTGLWIHYQFGRFTYAECFAPGSVRPVWIEHDRQTAIRRSCPDAEGYPVKFEPEPSPDSILDTDPNVPAPYTVPRWH